MAAITNLIAHVLDAHLLLLVALVPTWLCICVLYRLSPLHPLHHIPGPILPRITPLWLLYHAWKGNECTVIHALHKRYGTIVRTGPSSVHISSGAALHDIYSGSAATKTATTGFRKPAFYSNFDIDGHPSIFSALDPAHRAVRAKAVTGIFSTTALRKGQHVIDACVQSFIARLGREKERALGRTDETKGRVDLLNVSRGLAIDTVTSYLFGEAYGGCEEDLRSVTNTTDINGDVIHPHTARGGSSAMLTASGMVNALVAVGRFWYLPPSAFSWLNWIIETVNPDPDANASIGRVEDFVTSIVAKTESQLRAQSRQNADDKETKSPNTADTYQSRLLSASLPTTKTATTKPQTLTASEAAAQCKDVIFAGTDSTAMNLATILHFLCHPVHQRTTLPALRAEILASDESDDPQTLPLLRATVREGLRLGMANPSRLPRVVPLGGWTFVDDDDDDDDGDNHQNKNDKEERTSSHHHHHHYLPAGTLVGCSIYELHLNPDVFIDPTTFKPARWLDTADQPLDRMNRDFFPFSAGPRQCIARNLATMELFRAVRQVVRSGLLEDCQPVKDRIDILQWFNSKVVGEKIEVQFT